MTRPLLFSCLLLIPVGAHAQTVQELERYLDHLAVRGSLSGTILVARGDTVLLQRSYGKADYARGSNHQPNAIMPIASLTKPLTGVLIRRLADEGTLTLRDSIARWLPDFPRANEIRVEHLLSHRSGIPHRVTTPADEQKAQTPQTMTALVAARPLTFTPGERRMYSSAGYAVLARVAEVATGRTYADLLRTYVLAPAGARDSRDATELGAGSRVHGYFATGDVPLAAGVRDLSFLPGGGSLFSTPRDLFRVIQAIRSGKYGGQAIEGAVASASGAIQWNGFTNGFRAFADYDPATGVGVVFIGNVLTGAVDLLRRDVPRILAGTVVELPAIPRVAELALAETERSRLIGIYDFGGLPLGLQFVSPARAHLGPDFLLIATGRDTFISPADYAEVTVERGADGAVTALQYRLGPTVFPIRRIGDSVH